MNNAKTSDGQLYLEDFRIGDRFVGEWRELDQPAFGAFAAMTGDAHPIHYDEEYAKKTRFGGRLAHGLLLMSMTALGATELSHRVEGSMVAFIEQGCRFVAPVLLGDAVRSELQVGEVVPKPGRGSGIIRFDVRLRNRSGETVLEGFHKYILKSRDAA